MSLVKEFNFLKLRTDSVFCKDGPINVMSKVFVTGCTILMDFCVFF